MKLLSASVVVAGTNSVALADCGLCGDETNAHGPYTCPNFDYKGYGLSKGYKPGENFPDNDFLGKLALADRKNADAFLNAPKSTTVTFLSDNSDSATAVSESDTLETTAALKEMKREEAARARDRKELQAMVNNVIARDDPGDPQLNYVHPDYLITPEENMQEYVRPAFRKDVHEVAYANQEKVLERREARAHQRAVDAEIARLEAKAAHQRDTQELKDMMRERVAEDLAKSDAVKSESDVKDLNLRHRGTEEVRDVAYDNRANINISDLEKLRVIGRNLSQADERRKARAADRDAKELKEMMKASLDANREQKRDERLSKAQELRERREALENAREAGKAETNADELRKTQAAANKIQSAVRARLARKKADRLAQRQAQIDADRELAEKLQAGYDAEDAPIRARLAALEERQRRLEEEEAREAEIREAMARVQREEEERRLAEQESRRHAAEAAGSGVADEESETEHWTLPQATAWNFKGFDLEYNAKRAQSWARQLEDLSVRKIECMLWLISTSYQQLQNAGKYAPSAQMAEAISDVVSIFPYSGTNSGVMNVYNAFENTDTADFVQDLERLGTSGLDGVLYFVANRYMDLLSNGKKAASAKFIELAKATVEHFDGVWEAEEAEIIPDNKDVVEAPRDPVNFKATDENIAETEQQETEQWNPPYRIFYAYTHEIPQGLRPTSKSMRYYNDPELFRADLRSLTVRRMEVIIYLANGIYKDGLKNGASPVSGEFAKCVEDVDNVFPKAGEGEPDARVLNVYNAFKNLLDKPNDNAISMQPFQKGFRALTPDEKTAALGDIAVVYLGMLQSGKTPASPVFVDWANTICKELNPDGFKKGQNNTVAKPEAPEMSSWKVPTDIITALSERFFGDLEVRKEFEVLTVRQLEAVIAFTAHALINRFDHCEEGSFPELADLARRVWVLVPSAWSRNDERISNMANAVKNAIDASKFESVLYSWRLRNVACFVSMVSDVYKEKLSEGFVAADGLFAEFAGKFCETFSVKYERGTSQERPGNENAVTATGKIAEVEPVEDSEWYIPYGLHKIYEKSVNIHEERNDRRVLLANWCKELRDLGIRRLEVVMYLAACQFGSRNTNEDRIGGRVRELGKKMSRDLSSDNNGGNERLANFHRALRNRQESIEEFYNGWNEPKTYEDSFLGGFKRLNAAEESIILGGVACAYRGKLREGKRPSHPLFVEYADEVCNFLNLDGWMGGEEYDDDMKHPVYTEFDNAVNPIDR